MVETSFKQFSIISPSPLYQPSRSAIGFVSNKMLYARICTILRNFMQVEADNTNCVHEKKKDKFTVFECWKQVEFDACWVIMPCEKKSTTTSFTTKISRKLIRVQSAAKHKRRRVSLRSIKKISAITNLLQMETKIWSLSSSGCCGDRFDDKSSVKSPPWLIKKVFLEI